MNKFILADTSERRHLPDDVVEHTEFITGLEALSGGDFLITPSKIPANERTLKIHATKGLVVQRKNVADLVASFQGNDMRLWRQLIRLRQLTSYPVVLLVGDIKAKKSLDRHGHEYQTAVVDGRESEINYFAITGAIEAWQRRGGYVSWISRESLMLEWCQKQLAMLEKKEKRGDWDKVYIARQVLTPLEMLSATETTLCTFPNVGVEKARAIYSKAKEYYPDPNLSDCLFVVRDHKVDGIGDGIRNKILTFAGVKETTKEENNDRN